MHRRTNNARALALTTLACLPLSRAHAQSAPHALEPLTATEISRATAVLRRSGKVDSTTSFVSVVLDEPPKRDVLVRDARIPETVWPVIRRRAAAVLYDRARRRMSEAIVDVGTGQLVSWKDVPGVQAPFLPSEYGEMQRIVRADPQWQAAMRRRGIVAFDSVQIDPWSAGSFGLPGERGVRLWRALSYYKGSAENAYARPIEGVVAYVDMDRHRVMRLVDAGVVPVRKEPDDHSIINVK